MESTSVYWIPVYQILEARGLEVCLVNAQHVKNVPGRKTDVSDCQWLQYLHSVGLLRASLRPPGEICAIRSLWRHRSSLIQMAAEHVRHMQKALDQMNLQIHRVLNDITEVSGLKILGPPQSGPRNTRFQNRTSTEAVQLREFRWPEHGAWSIRTVGELRVSSMKSHRNRKRPRPSSRPALPLQSTQRQTLRMPVGCRWLFRPATLFRNHSLERGGIERAGSVPLSRPRKETRTPAPAQWILTFWSHP